MDEVTIASFDGVPLRHRLGDKEKSILNNLARPVRIDGLFTILNRDGSVVMPELQMLHQKKNLSELGAKTGQEVALAAA